ncbi:TetR/AcrR family transcriptional regulator [Bacterioplanoides sp.]|uniref:TetR/AcrR family transcriptional regulator n=1 Tax=Bacterioplanoides sp. TaxID=2066072 RepID=UPI003B59F100
MARPRRSEHSRQQLLELGGAMLSEKGYNGTGIKEILDAANVPKGSFYNFFSSKEDFAAEIIANYGTDLFAKMDAFLASSENYPAAEVLKTLQIAALKVIESKEYRQTCLIGSMASEIAASSDQCRQQLDNLYERWVARLEKVIGRGQQQGDFRQDIEARVLAELFWNQWQGSLVRIKVEMNSDGSLQTLDAMLQLLYSSER